MEPYRGLQPYTEEYEDFFFGRDAERAILIDKILSDKLTLLFSATGVGKSSLLQAAVMPELKRPARENLDVVYYNDWITPPLTGLKQKILTVLQERGKIAADFQFPSSEGPGVGQFPSSEGPGVGQFPSSEGPGVGDSSLEEPVLSEVEGGQGGVLPSSEEPEMSHSPLEGGQGGVFSLKQFLHICATFASEPLVIILDQFEEFFQYQRYTEHFTPFIEQLSEAIRDRETPVAFLISMREDFALNLNAFKEYLPTTLFENYYRLEKLEIKEAEEAIRKPVEKVGFKYEKGLLQTLLNDLADQERESRIGSQKALIPETAPAFVEPPNVQIVCTQLWEEEKNNLDRIIHTKTYNEKGGSKGFINSYFESVIAAFSPSEKNLTSKAFDHLVTPRGTKMAYPVKDLSELLRVDEDDLGNVLAKLEKARVLRSQSRKGVIWYELYHDIFSGIIYDWNSDYKAKQRNKRAFIGTGIGLIVIFLLIGMYDIIMNFTNYHLRLNPGGISDQIELYRGKPDSWDIARLQKYQAETSYTRAQIEPDKQFTKKSVAEYQNLNRELIGQLPIIQRVLAYWKTGEITKALALADKYIIKEELTRSQLIIELLADFRSERAFEILHKHLDASEDNDIRISILSAIGNSYFTGAIDGLLQLVEDQNAKVSSGATAALYKLSRHEAIVEQLGQEEIKSLLVKFLKNQMREQMMEQATQQGISVSPQGGLVDEATLLLAQLDIKETVRNLLILLEDQNSNIRSKAMTALYHLSTNDMVLDLLRREESIHMLKQYFTDRIRKQSAYGYYYSDRSPAYGYYYSDRSPELLARVKSDEAIGLLLKFLQEPDTDIQSRAIMALYQVSNHREGIKILRSHEKTGFLITFLKEQFQEQFKDQLKKQTSLYYQTQQYGYSDQSSYIKELLNRIDRTEILNVFVDLLKEPNRDIRINAAAGLGQLRDDDVIDPLVELLNDPDAIVRRNAVTTLGQLGSDKAIIPLIEILSNDPDGTVRRSAVMALGQLGNDKAVEPLISALNDPDETVRRSAAMALGQLGNDKAVEPLVELLKDRDPTVRMNAAAILGKLENRKGVAPLIELLKDPEPNVVGTAIGALFALTTDEEVLETFRNEYTVNLLGKIFKELEEFSPNSITIIELLVKINTRGAVNILVGMLKNPDVFWRYDIENALPRFNSQAVIGALATLLNHEYPEVRSSAASVLGQIDSDEVDRFLVEALKDRDANVRLSVVLALSQLGRKEAIEPLIELLGDRHRYVGVVLELGQIGSGETVEPLLAFLKARDQFIQPKAIEILAQLTSNEAVEPLLELLSDQNTAAVNQAVAALCCLNTSNLVEPALRLLHDYSSSSPIQAFGTIEGEEEPYACISYANTNSTAASVLGHLGSRKAVKPLMELLQEYITYQQQQLPYPSYGNVPGMPYPSYGGTYPMLGPSLQPSYSPYLLYPYKTVRAVAAETLGYLNSHEAIDLLIELLEVEDSELQRSAAVALGKLSADEAIESLKRLYTQNTQSLNQKSETWLDQTTMGTQLQLTLAAVLLGFEHQDGWELLQEKSLSKNIIERQVLVKTLGENPSNKGIGLLINMLDDRDKTVRLQVILSLGRAQAVRAVPYLHALVEDSSPKIRKASVKALGEIASPESVEILTQTALNPEERIFIRIAAIEGLGRINTEESVSALLEMLDTTDKHYHYKIVITLGKTRSQKALPVLLGYLEDLGTRRKNWRKIRGENTEGYTDEQRMDWLMHLRKINPKTSLEFELAYAIAQIDPDGEGVKLLYHDLAKVREGTWMGLARLLLTETRPFYLTDGPAAVKLIERLDRERIQSKNPLFRHAAYRAIDGMLITIETYGSKPDLEALEAFLPKVQDQEGVLTRVEWTIARLKEREEQD